METLSCQQNQSLLKKKMLPISLQSTSSNLDSNIFSSQNSNQNGHTNYHIRHQPSHLISSSPSMLESSTSLFLKQASMFQNYLSAANTFPGDLSNFQQNYLYKNQMLDFLKIFSQSQDINMTRVANAQPNQTLSQIPSNPILIPRQTQSPSFLIQNIPCVNSISSSSFSSTSLSTSPKFVSNNSTNIESNLNINSNSKLSHSPQAHQSSIIHSSTATFDDSFTSNSFMNRLASE